MPTRRVDFLARTPTGDVLWRLARCCYPTHPIGVSIDFRQFRLSDEFVAAAREYARPGHAAAIDTVGPAVWTPPFCPRCTHRDLASAVLMPAGGPTPMLELDARYEEDERHALAEIT